MTTMQRLDAAIEKINNSNAIIKILLKKRDGTWFYRHRAESQALHNR